MHQTFIQPFHDKMEYRYFSIQKIAEHLLITSVDYEAAKALVSSRQAKIERINFGYHRGYEELIGSAAISIEGNCRVYLRFSRDMIHSFVCDICDRYTMSGTMLFGKTCVHKVAALLLLEQYIDFFNPGDHTDAAAFQLMNTFRSMTDELGKQSLTASVQLTPKLVEQEELLMLKLQIGTSEMGRSYVVRNVLEMVQMIHNQEEMPLGKKNRIDFSISRLDQQSTALLEMLERWHSGQQQQDKYRRLAPYFLPDNNDFKDEIQLYGIRLDEFFELYQGESVAFFREPLEFIEKNPEIHLQIRPQFSENGIFSGVAVSGEMPAIYEGSRYFYYRTETCFCRMEEDYAQKIAPLIALQTSGETIQFTIGRKNLAAFYYSVLPNLEKLAVIEELESNVIEQYLPPEVSFCFYLDMTDGIPECRIEARYGEKVLSLTEQASSFIVKEEFRDIQRETQVIKTVKRYFPVMDEENQCFLSPDEETTYQLLEHGIKALMLLGEVQSTRQFQSLRIRKRMNISIGVSIQSDLLQLDINTADIDQQELMDILASSRKNRQYHRLKNGEFVNIDESIAVLSQIMETMQITLKDFVKGKMQFPAYRAFYLEKMLEQGQEIYTRRDAEYRELIKQFKTVQESDYDVPQSLNQIMRGYQRFGYKWLRTLSSCHFGGILADDMGLGKTLQMISVLLAEKEAGMLTHPALIICPSSLVYNWAAEFEKFAPQIRTALIVGTQKVRAEMIQSYESFDVLITSYDLLKRDVMEYESCQFSYQILDEAQYIKNHSTSASKSVKLIHSRQRFALTGTPIENRLSELWSIFDYLMPGFLYPYEVFKKELEVPITKKGDEKAVKRLRQMTAPFILRRLKQDVLRDLPEKLEENYIVPLEEEQRRIYDAHVLAIREELENENEGMYQANKIQMLSQLMRIRQICCDPSLLYESYSGISSKKEACLELIARAIAGEHRMLIFSQFTSVLDILAKELEQQGIEYLMLTGATAKKERTVLVNAFNEGNVPVFLISLKAGGTGLNLTGADVVIHYDPWWNMAAQNQATDRAYRIGQTKNVTVYKLIAKDTIEERIQQLQEKKKGLADSVITGEMINLSVLSKEELMEILK